METAVAAPARKKIFYGWWILAVSVTVTFFAASSSQLFTGAMLPEIQKDTGWSRSSITLFVTLGSMGAGFASPLFGRLADEHGPRLLSALGIVVVSAAMFVVALSSGVSVLLFGAAYVVARSMSQNCLSGVVPRTTMVNWFKRMRGRALGIVSMAIPLGGAVLVPIARFISEKWGWETVYAVFGAILLLFIPAVLLVLRRRPEDMGLLPDGDPAGSASEGRPARRSFGGDTEWTLQQAMRTRPFWLLIFAMTAGTCANGGVGFHQAAYFEDQGVAAAAAALAVSTYAISGAFANGLWGFAVEVISERVIGAFTVFIAGLLCLFLLTVDSVPGALAFAILFGLAARGESSIIVMIQAQYFGRNSFGAISGFSTPFQQVALGLGPTIAALIYDASGASYTMAFILFGGLFFAGAGAIWLSRAPAPTPEVLASQPRGVSGHSD
jgi:sugar phosphate permease